VRLVKSAMDGKLHSTSFSFGVEVDLVKMARAGDKIGVWVEEVAGKPADVIRMLPDVQEVSIECFCCW
jgi:hypothetical protein